VEFKKKDDTSQEYFMCVEIRSDSVFFFHLDLTCLTNYHADKQRIYELDKSSDFKIRNIYIYKTHRYIYIYIYIYTHIYNPVLK